MRGSYFSSDMKYESPWIDFETRDLETFLNDLVLEEYRVYDADTCGTEKVHFVVRVDGKTTFYEVAYSWWIDYAPHWELHDEIYCEIVEGVPFEFPQRNRDWLKL